jgi:vacuolar-type H+-ATPase subunit I/STV1
MQFTNLKCAILALGLIFSVAISVQAEEEAKKEEGGGKPAEGSKSQREFVEKSAKLSALQNHIEEADKRFRELVLEKAEAKSGPDKQAVIKEMLELTKQRNMDVANINKLKTDLIYRFPDQGDRLDKTYQTQGKRTVEEMEGAAGLDEMLTRTKKQVDKKFAPFMPEDSKPAVKAHAAKPEEEKTKRLKLEK